MSTRVIYKATNVNGWLAMIIGCGITVLVQSSSVTTSVLTPLVGVGVIQLDQMVCCSKIAAFQLDFILLMSCFISSLSHLEPTSELRLLACWQLW